MPSAVSGLTKADAPSAAVAPSGSGMHCATGNVRYCEYMAPPSAATVLPNKACAAAPLPAATTTPAPSLPTGMDCASRPAMALRARSGTLAVSSGRSALPEGCIVLMSAAPNSRPMSDGLMGAASRRSTTSLGPGSGVGTSTRDNSNSPVLLTSERNCRPLAGKDVLMKTSSLCDKWRGTRPWTVSPLVTNLRELAPCLTDKHGFSALSLGNGAALRAPTA